MNPSSSRVGPRWHPSSASRRAAGLLALLPALAGGCGAASGPSRGPAPVEAASAPPPPRVVVAAPTPLRRLSNEEYNNSVRDLLGDTSRPADAFPPDETVGGFENNTVAPVTQLLVERYMAAAEALAEQAEAKAGALAPCPAGEAHEACGRAFIDSFGRLAFRRPLGEGERASLLSLYRGKEARSGHARAVRLVVEAILQSPRFLYRLEHGVAEGAKARPLDGYELATRLSYFLLATTPDRELLDEAEAGALGSAEGVARAARRLLGDRRAVDGVRSFHRQWLGLRELEAHSRDAAVYPAFSPELRRAMVEETLRFSAHVVLSGGDAVSGLLTSRRSFVNAPLARLYGVPAPAGEGFAPVDLPAGERSGLLTQASVMTVLASSEDTAPINRGRFVREKLLCQPIPPPPPKAVLSLPKFDPKVTKRERFASHRTDPSCAGCHQMMDPIGFGFEHYDGIGAFRAGDGAFAVDATGMLSGTDADGPFDGAVALAAKLAASQQVRRCVATQWFRAAMGRIERDEDASSLDGAYQAFSRAGFDVRELLVAIVTSDAFRHTGAEPSGSP